MRAIADELHHRNQILHNKLSNPWKFRSEKLNNIIVYLKKWKMNGETSLTPLNFGYFCKYPPNVQNLSLRCSKVWFSLTLPIPYRNTSLIDYFTLTPKLKLRCFGNSVVLESRVKLVLPRKSERKPKFDTLK
jgi:hypothetical protein